jgi:hypothetical protein
VVRHHGVASRLASVVSRFLSPLRYLQVTCLLFLIGNHANDWMLEHPLNEPIHQQKPRLYWYSYTTVKA